MQQENRRRSLGSAGTKKIYEISTSISTTTALPQATRTRPAGAVTMQTNKQRLPPLRTESFAGQTKHQQLLRPSQTRRKDVEATDNATESQRKERNTSQNDSPKSQKFRDDTGDLSKEEVDRDENEKIADATTDSQKSAESPPVAERDISATKKAETQRKVVKRVRIVENDKETEVKSPPMSETKERQPTSSGTGQTVEVRMQQQPPSSGGQTQAESQLTPGKGGSQAETLSGSDCERHLLEAVRRGKIRLSSFILDAAPRPCLHDCRDQQGRTPIMVACQIKDEERRERLARLLLCRGADVCLRDNIGRTVLMHACVESCHDVLLLLLTHNVDPDAQDNEGNTALILSAQMGNEVAVETLLRHFRRLGLQVDRYNRAGKTALVAAAQNGHLACARALVVTGRASPSLPDRRSRKTPSEYLQETGYGPVELYFLRPPQKKFRNIAKLASSFFNRSRSTNCLLSLDSLKVPGSGPVGVKSSSCEDLSSQQMPLRGLGDDLDEPGESRCPSCGKSYIDIAPVAVPTLVVSGEAEVTSKRVIVVKDAACQTEVHLPMGPWVTIPGSHSVLGSTRRRSLQDFDLNDGM